jgi:hypothetical protein
MSLLSSLAALACGREPLDLGPAPAAGSGGVGGAAGAGGAAGTPAAPRVPVAHRPTATSCPVMEPPASPSPCGMIGTGSCKTDSECSDGEDGRCVLSLPSANCSCTYDACFADPDCPGGGVCACSGSYSGNACVSGNCHVDADCGVGGYCSPVIAACSGAVIGYQCHSQQDACVIDADCGVGWECVFFPNTGWACSPGASCPI